MGGGAFKDKAPPVAALAPSPSACYSHNSSSSLGSKQQGFSRDLPTASSQEAATATLPSGGKRGMECSIVFNSPSLPAFAWLLWGKFTLKRPSAAAGREGDWAQPCIPFPAPLVGATWLLWDDFIPEQSAIWPLKGAKVHSVPFPSPRPMLLSSSQAPRPPAAASSVFPMTHQICHCLTTFPTTVCLLMQHVSKSCVF